MNTYQQKAISDRLSQPFVRVQSRGTLYRTFPRHPYVGEVCDGGKPVDPNDLHQWVLDTYGPDVSVLY